MKELLPLMQCETFQRFAAGDPDAVDEFFDKWGGMLGRIASKYHRRCHDASLSAEDFRQEICIAVWMAAKKFISGDSDVQPLLFTMRAAQYAGMRRVQHACQKKRLPESGTVLSLNHKMDSGTEVWSLIADQRSLQDRDDDSTEDRNAIGSERIQKAMDLWKPDSRMIVERVVLVGDAKLATARELGRTRGYVREKYKWAIKRLRRLLAEPCEKPPKKADAIAIENRAIGDRIGSLRQQAGLTNRRLAFMVGMSVDQLKRLERGVTRYPSAIVIGRIATALGTSVEDLAASSCNA